MQPILPPSVAPTEGPIRRADNPRIPTWRRRWLPALLFTAGLTVLLVAHRLTPSATGMGTHEQVGMGPCGTYLTTGLPCPTCGYTTAFAHAAHGHIFTAFVVQPAGRMLALLTAVTVLISGYALVTGMPLLPLGRRLIYPKALLILAALFIGGWIYKIILVTHG